MKVSYFHHFLIISFIVFHSCNKSKRSYNDFEITIEKKRIDSINFEAKVIVSDKSQIKNNDKVYILIDKEAKLDSTIRNIKEKFLTNKEGLK
ncbi:MAG: hypothetical protein CMC48_01845 [Flavobacteriaceae bacterium]|nr:hypothetical protein [Flavobacteriaceae bacterium]